MTLVAVKGKRLEDNTIQHRPNVYRTLTNRVIDGVKGYLLLARMSNMTISECKLHQNTRLQGNENRL